MRNLKNSIQHAVSSIQCVVSSKQYAVSSKQYAVRSIQYAVRSIQYAIKTYWKKLPATYCLLNNTAHCLLRNCLLKNTAHCLLITAYFLTSCSESREQAIPVIADFEIQVVDNDYSVPVQVRITNTTEGAETYNWTFTGANPSSSTDRNPGTITFTEAGNYTIRLDASNQDESTDSKEITVPIDSEIVIGFTTEILVDNFPPMEVALTNTTVGADTYNWTFQDGTPTSSANQHPNNIIFNNPGEHSITLEVSNGLESYETEQTVTVAPHLLAAFEYEVAFEDDDFQAPVTLTMINNSISATNYTWTFTGGTPSTSTDENPIVTFNAPGTYLLELEATNGKETQTVTQSITVFPNTNIRTFETIQLGINTAHSNNNIGAFFSTTSGKVLKKEEVTSENGSSIDIAFFGLNQDFEFNKFVSPNEVQTLTFDAIPNATDTKFINVQESCDCSTSMSVAEFEAITDDTLEGLTITETPGGVQEFDNTIVPRIVLFETQDGRKGAIKIKDFVMDGVNSYIVIDIKVQKE